MIAVAVLIALVAQGAAEKPTLSPMFGSFVLAAGDVDGDGKDDFVIGDEGWKPSGSPAAFWVLSGATGREIYAFHAPDFGREFPHRVLAAGDVDQDRRADLWLILGPRDERGDVRVELWSGKTRAIARSASDTERTSVLKLAHDGRPFGDLDGDGVADRIERPGGVTRIVSGRDASVLVEIEGVPAEVLLLDDVDRDGRRDLLCTDPSFGVAEGEISLRSGTTGGRLWTLRDSTYWALGWAIDVVGDIDGDGVREILAGGDNAESHEHGQAGLYSGRNGAELGRFSRRERSVSAWGSLFDRARSK